MREGTHIATEGDDLQDEGGYIANLLGTLGYDQGSTPLIARSGSDADPFRAAPNQDLFPLGLDLQGTQHDADGLRRDDAGPAKVASAATKVQSREAGDAAADRASVPSSGDAPAVLTDPAPTNFQAVVAAAAADQADGRANAKMPSSLSRGAHGRSPAEHRPKPAPDGTQQAATLHDGRDGGPGAAFVPQIAGGAAGSTFVFQPGFGQETLHGLLLSGPDHDVIDLPSSDFANFAQVLNNTQDSPNGAIIRDSANGDTLILAGISKAQLRANPQDVAFHA